MGHTPFGYRIENGKAVVDEAQAEQIRKLYEGYLSGLALTEAAKVAGLNLYHGSTKRMMQNRHYLGDEYYDAIIDKDTFEKAEAERIKRAGALDRIFEEKEPDPSEQPTVFSIGSVMKKYDDPFKQAEYAYSLIESEAGHDE